MPRRQPRREPWFGIGHLALFASWIGIALAARGIIGDNSFLWHIGAGRLQAEQIAVITADPFSFTRGGEPWRTQSWLADLLYAQLDRWFGLEFVDPMMLLLGAIFLLGLGLVAFGWTRKPLVAALYMALTTMLSVAYFNPRPVIFSFLLFVALVLVERDGRLRWASPLLMWVWASVHGSFVIGGAYLLLQALRRGQIHKRFDILAAGVATLLTAHGLGVLSVLLEFGANRDALEMIIEWVPPDLVSPPFLPLLIGVFVLIVAAGSGRMVKRDAWLLVPFLVLAVSAGRAVPPAWIAMSSLVVAGLDVVTIRDRLIPARVHSSNIALAGLLVALPIILPQATGLDPERFPIDAAENLTEARAYHDDAVGGYLIYAKWPARLVFVDDRAELYGSFLRTFQETRSGSKKWREVFGQYEIREALVRRSDPLAETLTLAGWHETYSDGEFLVLHE